MVPIFIFDVNILKSLPKEDRRENLIFDVVINLKKQLEKKSSSLLILFGDPITIYRLLIQNFKIKKLYFNQDFKPYYPQERDKTIIEICKKNNILVFLFIDHVFFHLKKY